MDCREAPDLISADLDGALAPEQASALAAHLRDCTACTRLAADERELAGAIRERAPRYAAPGELRARLAGALAAEAAGAAPAAEPRRLQAPTIAVAAWRKLAIAASLAVAVVASSGVTAYFTGSGSEDHLVDELVSSHIRSLMADHLTDVASSDQHTVKPWFNGRIDLSPPVDDLARQGYPLIGGRLDYLADRPVAALVYRRHQHPINLFVLPAAGTRVAGSETFAERGYNVVHWTEGDMALWAVSDLNMTELREFERLYRQASSAP